MIVKRKDVHMSLFTMKKKHRPQTEATKLTCNQTMCPHFQQQRGCVGETTLYFVVLISRYAFFRCQQWHAHTFPLHNHLVATGPHMLHLLHLPTTRENLCLGGWYNSCYKTSWNSASIRDKLILLCACLIGNEPQNTLVFSFEEPRFQTKCKLYCSKFILCLENFRFFFLGGGEGEAIRYIIICCCKFSLMGGLSGAPPLLLYF